MLNEEELKLLEEFKELPDNIREEEGKYLAKEIRLKELLNKQEEKKRSYMSIIIKEVIDGKEVFSSDKKREIELNKRLNKDENFIELKKESAKEDFEIKELKLDIDHLKRKFSRIKYEILFLRGTKE